MFISFFILSSSHLPRLFIVTSSGNFATNLYAANCIKIPIKQGLFKHINKKMRMRKLQCYQHQNVYKTDNYPNNASYDFISL